MRRLVPILGLLLGLVPVLAPAQGQPAAKTVKLVIDFLDVGQGDAILLRSPEGKTALIDAGPSKDIVPLLKRRGVTSIDLVGVSHHHADHYGGMETVIREFRPRLHRTTVEGEVLVCQPRPAEREHYVRGQRLPPVPSSRPRMRLTGADRRRLTDKPVGERRRR